MIGDVDIELRIELRTRAFDMEVMTADHSPYERPNGTDSRENTSGSESSSAYDSGIAIIVRRLERQQAITDESSEYLDLLFITFSSSFIPRNVIIPSVEPRGKHTFLSVSTPRRAVN